MARTTGIEVQTFDDVFDALTDTPAEAANMKARSALLSALVSRVKSWRVSGSGGKKARDYPAASQRFDARQARQILTRCAGEPRGGSGADAENPDRGRRLAGQIRRQTMNREE